MYRRDKRKKERCFGYLVEVEHQIKLTNIAEEMVQNLDEQVDAFKVSQFIVRYVHTQGEKQASVSPVNDLVCSKLQSNDSKRVTQT